MKTMVGKQKKLDMNKDGKISGEDFKIMSKKFKKQKLRPNRGKNIKKTLMNKGK